MTATIAVEPQQFGSKSIYYDHFRNPLEVSSMFIRSISFYYQSIYSLVLSSPTIAFLSLKITHLFTADIYSP